MGRVEEEKRAKEQEERDWEKRRDRARRYLGVEISRPSSSGTQGGPAPVDTTEEEKRKKEEKEKTEKKEREEKERKEKKEKERKGKERKESPPPRVKAKL